MRKFSVRETRRTWKARLTMAAFWLLSIGLAVFFPSAPSFAESTSQVMAEDQWLMSIYQKGKDAYDRGDYPAANAEWDKLNAALDRHPAFRTVIDYLRGQAKSIPPDDANEVNKKLSERQGRIDSAFLKGKEYFEKGEFEKAFSEWDNLASYLPDESPNRQVLSDLKKTYQDSLTAKPAKKAAATQTLTAEESGQIRSFLESAGEELKKKAEQAKAAAGSPDAANQNVIKDAFERSKWLYFQGNYADSIAEIEKISSYFTQNSPERRAIEKMSLAYRQSQEVQKAAEEAVAKKNTKYGQPEDFTSFVDQAKDKFTAQVKEADVQKQAAEKISADRRSWAAADFQKARKFFEEGNVTMAVETWEKAAANFENEAELKGQIQSLKSAYEASLKAQQSAKEAEAKKDSKLSPPEDLVKILKDMQSQIQTQTEAAETRKTKAERSILDKQAFVSGGFQRGKTLFDEGKFDEAIQEWSPIVTGLEEEARLRPLLDQAAKDYQNLTSARKGAEAADARKDIKLQAPPEMEKLLSGQTQKLRQLTDASDEQRRLAEKHLADRQNIINNTFDKGKTMFEEGKFSEAVNEWAAMTSELDGADNLRTQMQAIESAYQGSVAAQQAAKEAQAKKDAKLPTPPELSKLLADVSLKIKDQTDTAQTRKQTAEQEILDKQRTVDEIFARGKLAVDQNDLPGGLKVWADLLPYLKDENEVKASLAVLNDGYENIQKTLQAAKDAETKKESKLATPENLLKSIEDISTRTKVEIQLANDRQQKAGQTLEDRQTLVRNTFLKGKAFYDDGKFADALREWSTILSNLEEDAKIKPLMDQASQDIQALAVSQKEALEAEQRKDGNFKTPEGLISFLAGANAELRIQIAAAEDQRKKSEEYLAQRQSQLNETIAKGNAFFEQDRWDEAKETWLTALPALEDAQGFQNILSELESIHLERLQVKKKINDANAWKDVKFKIPADISKELAEARERLLAQTQEAEGAKQRAVQHLAERQAQIQETFDRGKKFYWEGKIAEAIQDWTSITPHLEESDVKTSIQAVTANYENLLKLQQEAQGAELRKDSKLKTPEELPKLLGDAKQIIASQTQYAETQKKLADQTFVDRQSLINSTFQKGKSLYEQDRIPEALDEWATITPYLEKGSQLRAFIDNVAKNYQESEVAKKIAAEAEAKKSIKFQTPENLSKLLDEASQKLNAQVEDSKMQKDVAEKTRADRQAFIDNNFQKGKMLYENGNISGAVDAWTSLIPYIEDDAKIRQLILKVEENRRALDEATASAGQARSAEPVKAVVPDDFEKMLVESNQQLEKKTGEKGRAKLEADVQRVISNKKAGALKQTEKKPPIIPDAPIPMDEIEQMMVEYNISTPTEIEKRHQELKAIK